MKTLFAIAALSLAAGSVNAQKVKESEVPAPVKAGLAKQFPGASKTEWVKEDSNFEVEFEINKVETTAVIDPAGNVLETETEIDKSALPKEVTEYIAKNLSGKKIREAARSTDAKGVVTYEAQVEKLDYIFDSNGTFIKTVEKKDKKD